jgi:SARP family transcriptional regulator, regulator of embCAB operon
MYAAPRALGDPDDAGSFHTVGELARDDRDAVRFTLLGPLEVRKNGTDHAPTAPKVLQLLAMLVTNPGQVVHIDSIIQELWASNPPRSVRKTMHIYVHHLRRSLDRNGIYAATEADSILVTKPPGYLLQIDRAQVDVTEFASLRDRGRELLQRQEFTAAARSLRAGLELWAGPPMANVPCGPVLSAYAVDLLEQRRTAHQLRIEAEINGGMDRELIGELRSLVEANPLDEGLSGQLITVLGRSGRRSDAMACYRQLRGRLRGELGVEPCDELRQLHLELLSAGEPD